MTAMATKESLAGMRILIVEDEYLLAADLSRALQSRKVTVIGPHPDVSSGLRALQAGGIDAAVLDVNLRGQNSYPIAGELAARGIPFLFTTGYDDWAIQPEYAHVARLEKPFDSRAFLLAVQKLLGR